MKTQSAVIFASSEEVSQLDELRKQIQTIDGENACLLAPAAGLVGYFAVSNAFSLLEYEERYHRPMEGSRLFRTEAEIASAMRLYKEFTNALLEVGGFEMAEGPRSIAMRFAPGKKPGPKLEEARKEAAAFARDLSASVGISPEDLEKFKVKYEAKKGASPAQRLLDEPDFADRIMRVINANLDGPAVRKHVSVIVRRLEQWIPEAIKRTETKIHSAGTDGYSSSLAGRMPGLVDLLKTVRPIAASYERQAEAEPMSPEILTQAMEDLLK